MLKKLARLWTGSPYPAVHATDAEQRCRATCATMKTESDGSARKQNGNHGRDWRPRLYW